MLATVTNRSRGARVFVTLGRGPVLVEPGGSALLDLADHALHRAWIASGEVVVAPLPDKEAKAARRRLDADEEARGREAADALAGLPSARVADLAPIS